MYNVKVVYTHLNMRCLAKSYQIIGIKLSEHRELICAKRKALVKCLMDSRYFRSHLGVRSEKMKTLARSPQADPVVGNVKRQQLGLLAA